MVLPTDIFLVRHGESEGQIAMERGKKGDGSVFQNSNFKKKHSSLFRLSSRGVKQAQEAGKWIRDNVGTIDAFYVSEYIRAMETAYHLGIENAEWKVSFLLRERDWGSREHSDYTHRFEEGNDPHRKHSTFFFVPKRGESIAQLCLRCLAIINKLERKSDQKVLLVCHAETIRAFRVLFENMSQFNFRRTYLESLKHDNFNNVNNCQVIHYTRRDPFTKQLRKNLVYMRSLCPWILNEAKSNGQEINSDNLKWRKIKELGKFKRSNEDLIRQVRQIPRIVDNDSPSPLPLNYSSESFTIPNQYEVEEEEDDDEDDDDEEDDTANKDGENNKESKNHSPVIENQKIEEPKKEEKIIVESQKNILDKIKKEETTKNKNPGMQSPKKFKNKLKKMKELLYKMMEGKDISDLSKKVDLEKEEEKLIEALFMIRKKKKKKKVKIFSV